MIVIEVLGWITFAFIVTAAAGYAKGSYRRHQKDRQLAAFSQEMRLRSEAEALAADYPIRDLSK